MNLISPAFADTSAAQPADGGMSFLITIGLFVLIAYFMIFRPQSKRLKDQKNLMNALTKGDEVLTTGGLVGKINKIPQESDYIELALNEQTVITLKKDYISAILPKGSIQTL